ncbi:MAG: GNAT family N-acetyltransferase [archaeon]
MEKIRIEPLSHSTLDKTSKLAMNVFESKVKDEDYPPKWFKASLDFEKNKKIHQEFDVTSSRYWVALVNKEVLGVIGLYTLLYDENEAYWIGWYCVDDKSRGKGIGKALLDFAINKAKQDNKKYIRLYTSKESNEKRANEIYDKLGFKLMKKEKLNRLVTSERFREFLENYIYKELKLE